MDIKPNRLSNVLELTQMLSLCVQIQTETGLLLEEYHNRLYSLEEDRKRLLADYKALQGQIASLERRYSELLYKFADFRKS